MEILNELGNDLALAFLVEKKHGAKIDSKSALALIERVKKVLQPVSNEEQTSAKGVISEKSVGFSSH
jgi:hypothetical protein